MIFASGITEPEPSVTRPWIVPVVVWAERENVSADRAHRAIRRLSIVPLLRLITAFAQKDTTMRTGFRGTKSQCSRLIVTALAELPKLRWGSAVFLAALCSIHEREQFKSFSLRYRRSSGAEELEHLFEHRFVIDLNELRVTLNDLVFPPKTVAPKGPYGRARRIVPNFPSFHRPTTMSESLSETMVTDATPGPRMLYSSSTEWIPYHVSSVL